jgi:hypothetical protein
MFFGVISGRVSLYRAAQIFFSNKEKPCTGKAGGSDRFGHFFYNTCYQV